MRRLMPLPLSLAIAISLTACGSGSSDSTSNNDTPTSTPAVITDDNGSDIISGALELINGMSDVNALIINFGVSSSPKSATDQLEQRSAGASHVRFSESIHIGGLGRATSELSPCPVSGSYSLVVEDQNNDGVFNDGDTRTWAFIDCGVNEDITLKGNAISTIHSRVDTSEDDLSQTYTVDFSPLTVLDSSDDSDYSSVKLEGKRTVEIILNTVREYTAISATSLNLVVDGDTVNFTDMVDTRDVNLVSGTWKNVFSTQLDGSLPGGLVKAVTSPHMTGVVSIPKIPLEGILTVTGGNDSFVKLDAGTGNPATLMLDINGSSQVINWADFLD